AGETERLGDVVLPGTLNGLAAEIVHLAAMHRVADPLADDDVQLQLRMRWRVEGVAESRTAHHIARPAQFDVLLLHEAVLRELGVVGERDAGASPVALHTQALGQRAIVQVLAVPAASPGERAQPYAAGE